jgi:type III secretion protein J
VKSGRVAAAGSLIVLLAACGSETVVHQVDEREANFIIEVLAKSQIAADKQMVDTGRTVFYHVSVPSSRRLEAIKILNKHMLPRRKDRGYSDVFAEGGLIPTSSEERAKQLEALEGEIQRQLKVIEGVLDVEVQVVVPEESALRTTEDTKTPTTASVTVKYMPGAGGSKPLSEPQVQAIVAAGVEKLTTDQVVVVMTPVRGVQPRPSTPPAGKSYGGLSPKQFRIAVGGVVGLILLLGLAFVYAQVRLRTVRGRLLRLQAEIARARRKPEGSVG